MERTAHAYWLRSPGSGEIRTVALGSPGPGEVLVRALYSGVSRGTETLVFDGRVPRSQHDVMRAPFQEGDFPGPVKYGYLSVGVVEESGEGVDAALMGRTVFCLHPHQTRYVVPADAVTPVPEAVPARRAVLAGTVETAVNAVWDAAPALGDRIAVVGAGMVGACVASVLSRFPAARVQLVDADPGRAAVAAALGVPFALPADATGECDIVVHASASQEGLARSLELLAPDGEVIELSWYGDRKVSIPLGESFHSRRLAVRSSQVGALPPSRRARRGFADRMALALDLLADPAMETLITGESAFGDLPAVMPRIAGGELPALCHLVTYDKAEENDNDDANEGNVGNDGSTAAG
ncbi:dehydrogenase [Streptomyces abyssalis]|uniref:Dehydrogenase n=1 Tax=Streptomyces abyssalis TaxID=933944 RepID=A0A1E7JSW0_9ACTN|nr:zinc-binding alcohol dehydrogenase [Streptomyces abyssalis]OEU91970.1 dehydrogenase [Streptomyces abyssalis]OEU93887.1 dehydrogenase [Streptomyces abyssalis]OEV27658.1 dehydrogenase [Streptomyces nanshensis]